MKLAVLPLDKDERQNFRQCCREIDDAIFSLELAASSFRCIRDQRLYREEAPTFEAFCQARWKFTRRHINNLIRFAATVQTIQDGNLGTMVPKPARDLGTNCSQTVLPKREGPTRPLAALPPAEQPAAWAKAVEIAGGEQPTARQVAAAIREIKGEPAAPVAARDAAAHAAPIMALLYTLDLADPVQLHALRLVLDAAQDRLRVDGL